MKGSTSAWLTLGLVALAIAAGTSYTDFLAAIAQRESSLNPNAVNRLGYVGLFQMGTMAMTDAGFYNADGTPGNSWQGSWTGKDGVTSLAQLQSSPDLQIQAISAYYDKLQGYLSSFGLTGYIGQTVAGVPITLSGLIAGAHLVGIGALQQFLDSGGTIVPKDGNGVAVTQYIQQFGGYNVGGPAPTFAALQAAHPSGGVVATPGSTPTGSSTTSFAAGAVDGTDSGQAFYDRTGYSMGQVSDAIRNMLGAALFLWLGWAVYGSWSTLRAGGSTVVEFARQNLRAIIVMAVILAMLA